MGIESRYRATVTEILVQTAGLDRMSKPELCVSCENFSKPLHHHLILHATRKRVVPSPLFSFSRPPRGNTHRNSSMPRGSFPTVQRSECVISTLPLLNSIRHDTSPFLEAFRHRDRFPRARRSVPQSGRCLKVAFLRNDAICDRAHSYAHAATFFFPMGKIQPRMTRA